MFPLRLLRCACLPIEAIRSEYFGSITTGGCLAPLFFALLFCGILEVRGQDPDKSNIVQYTPGVIAKPGQIELKLFNNLYSHKGYRTIERKWKPQNAAYLTGIFQGFYGVGPRLNVGFQVWVKSGISEYDDGMAWKVLRLNNAGRARTAVSLAGPSVRFVPSRKVSNFSIQTTLLFPTARNMESVDSDETWLEFDRLFLLVQLYYDKVISSNVFFFLEQDVQFRIDKKFDPDKIILATPIKGFIGSFLGKKWGGYVVVEFAPFWGNERVFEAYYSQVGVGSKIQVAKKWELDLVYTLFPIVKNTGQGMTFNLGIRYLSNPGNFLFRRRGGN